MFAPLTPATYSRVEDCNTLFMIIDYALMALSSS
ncbi:hypothetical protein J2129_002604 [Methanofollis sp. W23]|nr:hypothetical protein [Methanofollis sp. W23]